MDPQSPAGNRFIVVVELLEDRSFPSVTVSFTAPGALLVRATNNQAHTVSVLDNNGTVTVTADGVAFGPLAGIMSIDYEGGNRDDHLLYLLTRSRSSGPITGRHNLVANLQSGHDVFTGVIEGNLGSSTGSQRAQVNLRVNGGTGGDTANLFDAGGIRPRSSLVYTATAEVLNAGLFNGTIAGFAGLNLNGTQNGSRGASVNATVTDALSSSGGLLIAVANGNGRNTDNVTVSGQVKGFL